MKNVSKVALVTTLVVGATILSSNPVSAFQGDMRGGEGMRGSEGMRQGANPEGFHLVSEDMKEEFRAEHQAEFENLSEEERNTLREEHRNERRANREEHQQEVADFVGVSTDELKEAHDNGVSMGEILTENGISQTDAETFLTEQATERANSIVEKHELSGEKEATVRARVTEFVQSILSKWFN